MTSETRIRVRYAETDQMGIVHHANYLVWMELGRSDLCRAMGLSYSEMEARDGVFLVVAEASCRYQSPAHYDEEVVVETSMAKSHTRLVEFAYRVWRPADGATLATGSTTHVFCGRDKRRMQLPEKYWEMFGIGQHLRRR